MKALKVTVVVGNPKPNSRTGILAQMLCDSIVGHLETDLQVIDLANHVDEIFKWPSQVMSDLNDRVAGSDLVVFATPTYKATYTGLLKSFLDRYPQNGLSGVPTLVLMTGTGQSHSMAPNTNLIPLLLELGAIIPTRGIFFDTDKFESKDIVIQKEAADIMAAFSKLSAIFRASSEHDKPE